jgi:hypothetical protein
MAKIWTSLVTQPMAERMPPTGQLQFVTSAVFFQPSRRPWSDYIWFPEHPRHIMDNR